MTPPSITTGVGPEGWTVVYLWPPEGSSQTDDHPVVTLSSTPQSQATAAGPDNVESTVPTCTPLQNISSKAKQTPAKPSSFFMDTAIKNVKPTSSRLVH
ncbi:hypothetical protein PM082_021260 [Marasmius tenuissimus]|nr:hypothetical protein PM082_021260 [Marasmius tenuissimus]